MPSYAAKKKLKLSEIQSSVEIVKVNKTTVFSEIQENSQYDYENFYQLFKEDFKKIVVRGKPGIGKTVQYKFLTYTWANNQWHNSDIYLLNLKIRDIKPGEDVCEALLRENFMDIYLEDKSLFMTKNMLLLLLEECKANFILFIDGADELNSRNESFKNLIECSEPLIKTVIWSRNWKTKDIMYDILFELKGFNSNQLQTFLKKCSLDSIEAKQFLHKLDTTHQQVKKMCEVPLLALHLFFISNANKEILGKTRFDIYSDIITLVNNEKDFSTDIIKKMMRESFLQLSTNKIFLQFQENEEKLLEKKLGKILQIIPIPKANGASIEFYHLSFQEYFAARYIINESQKENADYEIFKKMSVKNIFSTLNFIQDYSIDLFKLFLQKSSYLKDTYNLDESLKSYLNNKNTCNSLSLINKEFNNFTIFQAILNNQSLIREIYLHNPSFDHMDYLIGINKLCPKLEILHLTLTKKDFTHEFFGYELETLLRKIFHHKQIKLLKINDTKLKLQNDFVNLKCEKKLPKLQFKLSNQFDLIIDKPGEDIYAIFFSFLNKAYELTQVTIYSSNHIVNIPDNSQSNHFCVTVKNVILSFTDGRKLTNLKFNDKHHFLAFKNCTLSSHFLKNIFKDIKNMFKPIEKIAICVKCLSTIISMLFSTFENSTIALNKLYLWQNEIYEQIIRIFKELHGNEKNKHCKEFRETDCFQVLKDFVKSQKLLQKIDFSEYPLKGFPVGEISQILLELTTIKQINFGQCKSLRSGCLDILGSLITSKNSLQKICFRKCNLDEHIGREIGQILKQFTSIVEIDVGGNKSLNSGCVDILNGLFSSKFSLQIINFTDCSLCEKSGQNIGNIIKEFPSITAICVAENMSLKSSCSVILNGLLGCKDSLKKIYFYNCNLNEENCKKIGNILKNFTKITEIDAGWNESLKFGCIDVLNGLIGSRFSLQKIDFNECGLNEQNGQEIGKIFKEFTSMIDFDVGQNKSLKSGCVDILHGLLGSKQSLQRIYVDGCNISEQNAKDIGETLKEFNSVAEIAIGMNECITSASIDILNGLLESKYSLKKIDLNSCGLSEQDGTKMGNILKEFTSVTEIDVGWNESLKSGCVDILRGLLSSKSSLKIINFKTCNLNENNGKEIGNILRDFLSIQSINIAENESLKSGCVDILHGLFGSQQSLQKIYLCKCNISEQNAKDIGKILKEFTNLTEIDIGCNESLKSGCVDILNGLLESKYSLEKIDFNSCSLNEQHGKEIGKILGKFSLIADINLAWNGSVGSSCVDILKGLLSSKCSLKKINLNTCNLTENNGKVIGNILKEFVSIVDLNVAENKSLKSGCVYILDGLLTSQHSLQKIDFNDCSLSQQNSKDIGFALKQFTALKDIDIGQNKFLKAGCIDILSGLSESKHSLQKIFLYKCNLSEQNGKRLGNILKEFTIVTEIDVGWTESLKSGCVDILCGLTGCYHSLEKIDFNECKLNEHDGKAIANILKNFIRIKDIDVGQNKSLKSGCVDILSGLIGSQFLLQKICFYACNLSEQNGKDIGRILKQFTSVSEINIGKNHSLKTGCVDILNGLLQSKDSLKKIDIYKCNLDEKNGKAIGNILNEFSSITEIDASWNELLKSSGVDIITGLLQSKNSLRIIYFNNCNFSEENGKKIGHILQEFTCITDIDIGQNEYLQSSCVNIMTGLIGSKHTLKRIYMNRCNLNEQNGKEIGNVLKQFISITEMDVGGNESLQSGCIDILNGLLQSKYSLEKIIFLQCNVTKQDMKEIMEVLKIFPFIPDGQFPE